jgi:hypothetical protein
MGGNQQKAVSNYIKDAISIKHLEVRIYKGNQRCSTPKQKLQHSLCRQALIPFGLP